jgi:hypothetical protein
MNFPPPQMSFRELARAVGWAAPLRRRPRAPETRGQLRQLTAPEGVGVWNFANATVT